MAHTPRRITELRRQVAERDEGLCVMCGRAAVDIHEIIPRTRKAKWSSEIFREENMCCLCRDCHDDGQTVWMRKKLIREMQELGHDMSWAQDEVVMEE